jgi:hypothetical protein
VTDFQDGVDHFDLRQMLTNSGYTGTDPIGAGYIKVLDNGGGGTWLYYDSDGFGTADQWGSYVANVNVAPSALTNADFLL